MLFIFNCFGRILRLSVAISVLSSATGTEDTKTTYRHGISPARYGIDPHHGSKHTGLKSAANNSNQLTHHPLHSRLSDTRSETEQSKIDYCNRPWPELALFVPLGTFSNSRDPRYYEFETIFLRSFLLFWPLKVSNTSLLFAYDEEKDGTPYLNMVRETLKGVENQVPGGVQFVPIPHFPQYYQAGYDRQQYTMFYADNFTTAEYVGFCDTDAALITYIDREDVFEVSNKTNTFVPVVNARAGAMEDYDWTVSTYRTLGILQPFKCMSYFPMIVKTAHLKEIRDYIAKHHKKSFDRAFRENINNEEGRAKYSQFAIFCTYLWKYRRSDYKWYVHDEKPDWDDVSPPPIYGQDGEAPKHFTAEMRRPKPRVATHVRYRRRKYDTKSKMVRVGFVATLERPAAYNQFLQLGVCYAPPFPRPEYVCADIDPTKYHFEMHHFDYVDYAAESTPELLNEEAKKRHERLKYCNHTWNADELSLVMKPSQ